MRQLILLYWGCVFLMYLSQVYYPTSMQLEGPPDWALPLHAAQGGRVYDRCDRVDDMLFVPTDKL